MKVIATIFLVALAIGCHSSEQRSVVARVNETTIDADEFKSRLNEYRLGTPLTGSSPDEMDLKKTALNEMIEEVVLLTEAKRRNLSVPPEDLDQAIRQIEADYPSGGLDQMLKDQKITKSRFRDRMRNRILLEKLNKDVVKTLPQPSPDDIHQYFVDHLANYRVQERLRALQIVVKTEEEAKLVVKDLEKGTPFTELAQKHSFTPEASQGGNLGWFTKGMLPKEVETAIWSLPTSRLSPVIQSEYGFHIMKVMERQPERVQSLEEATPDIVRQLTEKERDARFSAWRNELLSKAKVERNHALLASIH